MAEYFHTITSGGDLCAGKKDMYIVLYPNSTDVNDNYVKDSTSAINTALKDACDQLLNHGAIDYYEIQRFHAERYNYPCIDVYDSDTSIINEFDEYLTSTKTEDQSDCVYPEFSDNDTWNGTGDNLLSIIGCHTLVHDAGCSVDLAAYGGTEPYDDPTCDNSETSWSTGRTAWSSATCDDMSQAKASIIQEPLHTFIIAEHPDVKPMLGADNDDTSAEEDIQRFEEHSLGIVDNTSSGYRVTPMLTYHDHEFTQAGTCKSDTDTASQNTTSLTSCTKDAVEFVASDSNCNSQSANIC